MLPWGTDQAWEPTDNGGLPIEFDGQDGRLFDLCREDEACSGLYSAAVDNALKKVGGLDLAAQAEKTAAMLAPWQALEVAPRDPYTSGQIADAVADTIDFIRDRPAEAKVWLAAHPPPAEPEPPVDEGGSDDNGDGSGGAAGPGDPGSQPGAAGSGVTGGGSAPATASPRQRPLVRLHGQVFQSGRLLSVQANLSDPGWVRLDGRLEANDGSGAAVCSGWRRSRSAGSSWVSCRLSHSAWRQLRFHSLPIVLQVDYEAVGEDGSGGLRAFEIPRRFTAISVAN
jgi:hypothetical protein